MLGKERVDEGRSGFAGVRRAGGEAHFEQRHWSVGEEGARVDRATEAATALSEHAAPPHDTYLKSSQIVLFGPLSMSLIAYHTM